MLAEFSDDCFEEQATIRIFGLLFVFFYIRGFFPPLLYYSFNKENFCLFPV